MKNEKKKKLSEDFGSPILKNMLNGSSIPRTVQGKYNDYAKKKKETYLNQSDKNILLGPPKTNFVSSLYVKKNEDGSMKHTTRHKTQHVELICTNSHEPNIFFF